ncbi:MAG TPA: carboxypeptidase-like regulatory domain-containing protein [Thermoanaerobaculia bacterium]|nr:carboxypeptidase-like regulatory domain-containing protein [Thermoanaerobaculia bacterium]
MTNRFPLFRSAAVVALSLLVASVAFAAQKPKRRAVAPGSGALTVEATLTGAVTDATTGAPVVAADVFIPGKSTHTDASGNFTMKLATGRDFVLTIARTGFETLTATVNISGDASRNFRMTPRATTKVRTVNGTNYELDTETIEFGYVAPFFGYVKDTKLNLCQAGGTSFTPDRSEIDKITGPVQLNDAACCSRGSMPAVNVTLKSGGTSTAAFVDACVGYQVDVIGRDHRTNAATYLHFSDLAEIDLP